MAAAVKGNKNYAEVYLHLQILPGCKLYTNSMLLRMFPSSDITHRILSAFLSLHAGSVAFLSQYHAFQDKFAFVELLAIISC